MCKLLSIGNIGTFQLSVVWGVESALPSTSVGNSINIPTRFILR
jgi:hypothetical protein